MLNWNPDHIKYYYEGVKHSEYPRKIWAMIQPFAARCNTVLDIGCGGGAFSIMALEQKYAVTALDISKIQLGYLRDEARLNGLEKGLTIIEGDFADTTVVPHDIAIAAYCFEGNISNMINIEKILHCTNKLGVFVLPGEIAKHEFLSELLPVDAITVQQNFHESGTLKNILEAADGNGIRIIQKEIICDFGIPYDRYDPYQVEFVAKKLGITDLVITRKHIEKIKILNRGMPWLPNMKKMIVILVFTAYQA